MEDNMINDIVMDDEIDLSIVDDEIEEIEDAEEDILSNVSDSEAIDIVMSDEDCEDNTCEEEL